MRRILRASLVMAGASSATILSGLVRSKIVALVLGPAGLGAYGLLQSVQSLVGSIAGAGLSNAGVRQVADAAAGDDPERLTQTRTVIYALASGLALLGALATLLLRVPISIAMTGSGDAAGAVAWLSVGVFATALSGAGTAWLNGTQQLKKLSLASAVGAGLSVPFTIPVIYLLGEAGIAIAVSLVALSSMASLLWFARDAGVLLASSPSHAGAPLSRRAAAPLARGLLVSGLAFMATGLLTVAVQTVVRILVNRQLGTAAAGEFQAAWSISMLYVGFVIQAMAADFFPRITAVRDDAAQASRLINEQTEVVLLVAAPIMFGVLALTQLLITVLYSSSFTSTAMILRWQILGDIFKLTSFPLAYALLARGDRVSYLICEALWAALYMAAVATSLARIGLEGTGVGFVLAYAAYAAACVLAVRRSFGHRMSSQNRLFALGLAASALLSVLALRFGYGLWFPLTSWGVVTAYCASRLRRALRRPS